MPVNSTEIRKFAGLYLQANSFNVPDGAMEVCSNVELQSDGILTKTKGWYTYYSTATSYQAVVTYQNRLVAIGGDIIYFNSNSEISTDSTYSPQNPAVSVSSTPAYTALSSVRTSQQNNNLYFTAVQGIQKLESYSTTSRSAGVPPALDLRALAGTGVVGPLVPNSQTSYRILFGRRDLNLNLLLSSPSDISTIGLSAGATGRAYTSVGAGPYTITVTTLLAHGLRIGDQIIVTNGTSANANGTVTITAVGSTLTFSYSVALNPGAGTLDYTFTRTGVLEFTIPSEISDATAMWFYQVYRSSGSASVSVSPSPDFALISEVALSATDLTNKYIIFTDTVDAIVEGAQLYTNPNSREGELQANTRPPKARDIIVYKGYSLYGNAITKQRLFVTLVNPTIMSGTSQLLFKYDVTTETYACVQSGTSPGNMSVNGTAAGVTTVVITYTAHGASNGWVVQLEQVTGTVPVGDYTIFGVTANTFSITSTGNTASAVIFAFKTNGTNPIFSQDSTSSSLAVQIANTAYSIVKAVNRNSALMYANYTSGFDDAPGNMRFELKTFDALDTNLYMSKNLMSGVGFVPPVPDSFASGQQLSSTNDVFPDGIFISKYGEPEAVPIVNFLRVGVLNSAIKRIFALRDAVIVLKEDGIFKITGDVITQFSVTTIDSTVLVTTEFGADKINNTVMALSNQGIVSITDSSVQIVSSKIDDLIQPISGTVDVGSSQYFCAFGFEQGRTWYLSQLLTLNGIAPVTYAYDVLNQAWTTTDQTFKAMGIGPSKALYLVNESSADFKRQRNTFTLVDYTNEYAVGTAYSTGTKTAYAAMVSGNIFVPEAGDVLVVDGNPLVANSDVINRITAVAVNGIGYNLTFANTTSISSTPSTACRWYQGYQSDVEFSPFHAGEVGREKFFTQFQMHMRQQSITNMDLSFTNANRSAIGSDEWNVINISENAEFDTQGWGDDPWGLFPWGQVFQETITMQTGTKPSVAVRTYIPLSAARSTYIQAILGARQACEGLFIQQISYMVRGYNERVTK